MNDRLRGRATQQGTAAFMAGRAATTAPGHFRTFRGLSLSSIGMGTYLGNDDDATDELYRSAALRALELGINVFDTAINYRNQRSERALGRAIREAVANRGVERSQIVIATKGGFLPFDGSRPPDPQRYIEERFIRTGLCRPDEIVAGCHCMAPAFLASQLEQSLSNLGMETVDIYYLHNPETQFEQVSRLGFSRRLRAAFEFLESACASGKVGAYGVATWTGLRQPPSSEYSLSLAELVTVAKSIAGEKHHFQVVQLPLNAAMTDAYTKRTQTVGGRDLPLLQAAAELGIYVMTSASIMQGKLAGKLPARVPMAFRDLPSAAACALQLVRSTPGVGTALVGMKQLSHVEQIGGLARIPPAPPETIRQILG